MKQSFFLLAFFLLSLNFVQAQATDSLKKTSPTEKEYINQQAKHEMYLKKGNNYRAAGWVLLGTGALLMTIGIVRTTNDLFSTDNTGEILFFTGLSCSVLSIPCFIIAGKNKKKASLALKENHVSMGNKMLYKSAYPAVALTVSF